MKKCIAGLALMGALTAAATFATPVHAQSIKQPWTVVGSTGIVDDANQAVVDTDGTNVSIKSGSGYNHCVLRYPVTYSAGMDYYTPYFEMDFISPNASGDFVYAALYSREKKTGSISLLGSITTSGGGSTRVQTQRVWLDATSYDFTRYTYFVQVFISRNSSAASQAKLCSLTLGSAIR